METITPATHDFGDFKVRASEAIAARDAVIAWIGEVGPRWGLSNDLCRMHALLFLSSAGRSAIEIADVLAISPLVVGEQLAALCAMGLADERAGIWTTNSDPWMLLIQAMEARRAQEIHPALEVLRTARQLAANDPPLAIRIGSIAALVQDLAAIDAHAQRLSPAMLRRLLKLGGRAARLFG